jgi:hypothetical protein
MFREVSRDSCDVWALAGRRNAALRAKIMSGLKGERVPQAKSGVNAIRKVLADKLGVRWESGECLNEFEGKIKDAVLAYEG